MTRTCLHLGVHEHTVKVGEDQEIKERTRKLIEEQVLRNRSRGLQRPLILPSS
jgi:hypothetical protein